MSIYICRACGNMAHTIVNSGVPMVCCGKHMEELVPNTVEASGEKHIPAVDVIGDEVQVKVGSVGHPMAPEHFIEWIYLETKKGGQCKRLVPGEAPTATFALKEDEAVAAYAYCNLHGLWKAEVKEKVVCDLKPLDMNAKEDYIVCKCNQVSYFDILDEVQKHDKIDQLLDVFEDVKNTTHCSTGCGGCYDKVIAIISEAITAGKR